jgi:hypothetical protein
VSALSFGQELREYARTFLTNLDQPGMPATEKWAKLVRNRFKAFVTLKGCCGHPGQPGC